MYEFSVQKVRSVYSPKQEQSLDEAMISWQGRLKFRTYNPRKITKYGELARMVCEAVSGYICSLEINSGKEVGGNSVINFREKLGPKSSHLSRQFL